MKKPHFNILTILCVFSFLTQMACNAGDGNAVSVSNEPVKSASKADHSSTSPSSSEASVAPKEESAPAPKSEPKTAALAPKGAMSEAPPTHPSPKAAAKAPSSKGKDSAMMVAISKEDPMASTTLQVAMKSGGEEGKFYWACAEHPGGICSYTDTYQDAKDKWEAHKKATGHTDGGPSSGSCPFEGSMGKNLNSKAVAPESASGMVNPQTAKCPFCFRANVSCCSVCGACGQHAHAICSGTSLGMKGAHVGNCASGNASHNGALICSKDGFCGVHGHAH